MSRKDLLSCTRTVADVMMDMCGHGVFWSYDLGGGCAIGATVLFRYLMREHDNRAFLAHGWYRSMTHAFVLVDIEGVMFVADPTFVQFGEWEDVMVAPFRSPIRKNKGHRGYVILRYTSCPSRINELFSGWGIIRPAGKWKPVLSELKERMREVDGDPQDPRMTGRRSL